MANITLLFSGIQLNTSVQIGDIAYYTPLSTSGGFSTSSQSDIVEIGTIDSIVIASGNTTIVCTIATTTVPPSNGDFILFSKDNKVNSSSVLGYYGLASIKNNSNIKSEIFSVACDMFESSK